MEIEILTTMSFPSLCLSVDCKRLWIAIYVEGKSLWSAENFEMLLSNPRFVLYPFVEFARDINKLDEITVCFEANCIGWFIVPLPQPFSTTQVFLSLYSCNNAVEIQRG